jgi:uncharacterized damage-inducible protein DinB
VKEIRVYVIRLNFSNAKKENMKEQLLATLENSKKYTLEVAEAMPQSGYDYKPADNAWNFGELLNHIAYGIEWWTDNNIKKVETEWNQPTPKKPKKEIIEDIKQAYSSLKKTLEKVNISNSVIDGFYSTINHITHHRAQAVTYLRSKEKTPPEYSY